MFLKIDFYDCYSYIFTYFRFILLFLVLSLSISSDCRFLYDKQLPDLFCEHTELPETSLFCINVTLKFESEVPVEAFISLDNSYYIENLIDNMSPIICLKPTYHSIELYFVKEDEPLTVTVIDEFGIKLLPPTPSSDWAVTPTQDNYGYFGFYVNQQIEYGFTNIPTELSPLGLDSYIEIKDIKIFQIDVSEDDDIGFKIYTENNLIQFSFDNIQYYDSKDEMMSFKEAYLLLNNALYIKSQRHIGNDSLHIEIVPLNYISPYTITHEIKVNITTYCGGIRELEAPCIVRDREIGSDEGPIPANRKCEFHVYGARRGISLEMDIEESKITLFDSATFTADEAIDEERLRDAPTYMKILYEGSDTHPGNKFRILSTDGGHGYTTATLVLKYKSINTESNIDVALYDILKSRLLYDITDRVSISLSSCGNVTCIYLIVDAAKDENDITALEYCEDIMKELEDESLLQPNIVEKPRYEDGIYTTEKIEIPSPFLNLDSWHNLTMGSSSCDAGTLHQGVCYCFWGMKGSNCNEAAIRKCTTPCETGTEDCCTAIRSNLQFGSARGGQIIAYNYNTNSFSVWVEHDCFALTTGACIVFSRNGKPIFLPNGDFIHSDNNNIYIFDKDTGELKKKITSPCDSIYKTTGTKMHQNLAYLGEEYGGGYVFTCQAMPYKIYWIDNNFDMILDAFEIKSEDQIPEAIIPLEGIEYTKSIVKETVTETISTTMIAVNVQEVDNITGEMEEKCRWANKTIITRKKEYKPDYESKVMFPRLFIQGYYNTYTFHPSSNIGWSNILQTVNGAYDISYNQERNLILVADYAGNTYAFAPDGRLMEQNFHLGVDGTVTGITHMPYSGLMAFFPKEGMQLPTILDENGFYYGKLGSELGSLSISFDIWEKPDPVPQFCEVSGLPTEAIRAGNSISLTLKARYYNNIIFKEERAFFLDLEGYGLVDNEYRTVTYSGNVEFLGEGTYRLSYRFTWAADYKVHINLGKLKSPIKGSPSNLKILSGIAISSKSKASGDGLSRGTAGADNVYIIEPKDEFENLAVDDNPEFQFLMNGVLQTSSQYKITIDSLGKHHLTYYVEVSGEKTYSIQLKDTDGIFRDIIGSPFAIIVSPNQIDYTMCEVTGNGVFEVLVEEESVASLRIKDSYNNLVTSGGYEITAEIYPIETKRYYNVSVTEEKDGTYTLRWNCPVYETVHLIITVDGEVLLDKENNNVDYFTIILKNKKVIFERNIGLVVICYLFSCACLIYNIGILGLIIKYRNEKILKFSQVNFLCIMVIGGILLSLSMFFITANPSAGACGLAVWCGNIGYALVLSTLYVKTWRVDKIFNNKQLKTLRITDGQMYLRLGLLTSATALALIIMTAVEPFKKQLTTGPTKTSGILTTVTIYPECPMASVWLLAILLIVQIGMLILGGYLGYRTRNVADAFREAKSIFVSIYCVILVGACGIICLFGIDLNPNLYMVILDLCIGICTCVVVTSILYPKFAIIFSGTDVNAKGETTKTAKFAVTGASMTTQANQQDLLQNLVEITEMLGKGKITPQQMLEMKKFVVQAGKETILVIKKRQFASHTSATNN